MGDNVNHPNHYNKIGIECIEIARTFNFNCGCALKYVWRYEYKGDAIEDLKKALWYLNDELVIRRKLPGAGNDNVYISYSGGLAFNELMEKYNQLEPSEFKRRVANLLVRANSDKTDLVNLEKTIMAIQEEIIKLEGGN